MSLLCTRPPTRPVRSSQGRRRGCVRAASILTRWYCSKLIPFLSFLCPPFARRILGQHSETRRDHGARVHRSWSVVMIFYAQEFFLMTVIEKFRS